jgi:hypothetical protein
VSAAHQMREKKPKIMKEKMFFVMHGEDLTHQRLHNHITKNILLLQPFNIILTKILFMN